MTRRAAKYPLRLARALARLLCYGRKCGYVLDAYAGSGIVGRQCRQLGVASLGFELSDDIRQDMTISAFDEWLEAEASAGKLRGAMLALPCRTFSLAQSRGGRAIRSQAEPRGLAHLTNAEQARADEGNRLLDSLYRILDVLNRHRVPYVIENPSRSYLWHDPRLLNLLASRQALFSRIHQCSYGAPWRKATTLAIVTNVIVN